MPKISESALREVQAAFERYKDEVETSKLQPDSKDTYLGRTEQFVRWLNDDFTPGATVGRR